MNAFMRRARNLLGHVFGAQQPVMGAVAGEVEAPAQIHQGPLTRRQRLLREQEQSTKQLYPVIQKDSAVIYRLPKDKWCHGTVKEVGVGEYRVGGDGEVGRWIPRMEVFPVPPTNARTTRSGRVYGH